MANYYNSTFKIKPNAKRLQSKTGLKPKSQKRKEVIGPRKKRLQKAVFERDGHKCVLCGKKDNLQAHHLYEGLNQNDERSYILEGVVTLCYNCHIINWHGLDIKFKKEAIELMGWQSVIDMVKRGEGTVI